jgi:hypothetical protein
MELGAAGGWKGEPGAGGGGRWRRQWGLSAGSLREPGRRISCAEAVPSEGAPGNIG